MENMETGKNVNFRELVENNLFVEIDNVIRIDCVNATATIFGFCCDGREILFRDCEIIESANKFTIIAPNQEELIFVLGELCDCWQCFDIFTIPLQPKEPIAD